MHSLTSVASLDGPLLCRPTPRGRYIRLGPTYPRGGHVVVVDEVGHIYPSVAVAVATVLPVVSWSEVSYNLRPATQSHGNLLSLGFTGWVSQVLLSSDVVSMGVQVESWRLFPGRILRRVFAEGHGTSKGVLLTQGHCVFAVRRASSYLAGLGLSFCFYY